MFESLKLNLTIGIHHAFLQGSDSSWYILLIFYCLFFFFLQYILLIQIL